jgi:hypothetical protein
MSLTETMHTTQSFCELGKHPSAVSSRAQRGICFSLATRHFLDGSRVTRQPSRPTTPVLPRREGPELASRHAALAPSAFLP